MVKNNKIANFIYFIKLCLLLGSICATNIVHIIGNLIFLIWFLINMLKYHIYGFFSKILKENFFFNLEMFQEMFIIYNKKH